MMSGLVYLNNAAQGFPKADLAIETHREILLSPPSGARQHAECRIQQARASVASSLETERSSIVFCASATVALNQALQGVLTASDHCLVDNRAHNAVLRTLANTDTSYDVVPLYDIDDMLSIDDLLQSLKPETKMVCLTHVSNVTGSVFPVTEVIQAIRQIRPDVAILVDSSQAAGLVDLKGVVHADFVAFSSHKYLHGVPGAAVLVANRAFRPLFFGGTGTHSTVLLNDDLPSPPTEVGTFNESAICALAAVLREACESLDPRREHVRQLTARLWEGLESLPMQLIGRPPSGDRIGVISMRPAFGHPETDWAPFLRSQGIIARGGLHCSPSVHHQLGLTKKGTLRVSLSVFNTPDDVDTFLEAAEDFISALRNARVSE